MTDLLATIVGLAIGTVLWLVILKGLIRWHL